MRGQATRIVAEAPSRIDLAGGTLDVYPIYLLEEGALTVNMAISLMSQVRIDRGIGEGIRIVSQDLGEELCAPDAESLEIGGALDLLARAVRFYGAPSGTVIRTRNTAPPGSGLGASSSLLIALSAALRELNELDLPDHQMIANAAEIEAQNIRIPTGKQDYYAAVYGGMNAIWFNAGVARIARLGRNWEFMKALQERLILVYTGKSRCSAWTNWHMLYNYIDGHEGTRERMARIRQVALAMRTAIEREDLEAIGGLMNEEWEARRGLAEDVDCEEIQRVLRAAREAGAVGGKVCGAGGGGCMVVFAAAGRAVETRRAISATGAQVLDYEPYNKPVLWSTLRQADSRFLRVPAH